jgi:hypothetical protein
MPHPSLIKCRKVISLIHSDSQIMHSYFWNTTDHFQLKLMNLKEQNYKPAYSVLRLVSSPISLGMGPVKPGLPRNILHMSQKKLHIHITHNKLMRIQPISIK